MKSTLQVSTALQKECRIPMVRQICCFNPGISPAAAYKTRFIDHNTMKNQNHAGLRTRVALFVAVMLCSGFLTTAHGQGFGGQNMEERLKAQIDEVMTAMALAEEKDVEVRLVLEEEMTQRMSIMQGFQGQGRNARAAMREEMTALEKKTEEKLKAVLSEEEMEKYAKIQSEIRERRRGQFGGGRRGGGQPRIN